MRCCYCDSVETKVIDSRPSEDNTLIRRRRECPKCGKRFTTLEGVERVMLFVVKRDGSREEFDVDKIRRGVVTACEKTSMTGEDINGLVQRIVKEIYDTNEQEVKSEVIGEMVLKHLKDFNEVCYIRFAAVYRQFKDIDSFLIELRKLQRGE